MALVANHSTAVQSVLGWASLCIAAQEKPPGVVEETEDGFFIFNNDGKLRRVPEDWKFPHCPLAAGCELRQQRVDDDWGMSPIKMLEKSDVDCSKQDRQNLHEFKHLMEKEMLQLRGWEDRRATEKAKLIASLSLFCARALLGFLT